MKLCYKTTSVNMGGVLSSNYYTGGGFANPQVLSKDLYSGETTNEIKLPDTGTEKVLYNRVKELEI